MMFSLFLDIAGRGDRVPDSAAAGARARGAPQEVLRSLQCHEPRSSRCCLRSASGAHHSHDAAAAAVARSARAQRLLSQARHMPRGRVREGHRGPLLDAHLHRRLHRVHLRARHLLCVPPTVFALVYIRVGPLTRSVRVMHLLFCTRILSYSIIL